MGSETLPPAGYLLVPRRAAEELVLSVPAGAAASGEAPVQRLLRWPEGVALSLAAGRRPCRPLLQERSPPGPPRNRSRPAAGPPSRWYR